MNRLLLHIALLLCAPRSFGYAIRTGLISAFAMRLIDKTSGKFLGITIAFPFGQRTLFPYIQNGRITYPPERVMRKKK